MYSKDKKPYGVYKVFYEDGTLQEIGFIDEGKVNSGTKRVYYPNGKLRLLYEGNPMAFLAVSRLPWALERFSS